MKQIVYLLTVLTFIACGQAEKQKDESQFDARAIELNDKGTELVMTFDKDSIEKAIELFDQATKIDSNYYLAYWNKCVYLNKLGRRNEALKTLQKLEELKPTNPDLKVTAGIVLELNGDSLSAKQKFLEADKFYSNIIDSLANKKTNLYWNTLVNKAVNLKLLGQVDEANRLLKIAKSGIADDSIKEMIESLIAMSRSDLLHLN